MAGTRARAAAAGPGTLGVAIGRYLEWLAVRNFSPRTAKSYRSCLGKWRAWCAERGIERAEEVTRGLIERYQRALLRSEGRAGRPLTARSQYSRLSAVRAFFRYLVRHEGLAQNPTADLEMPRLGERLPPPALSAAEAERVLAEPDLATPLGLRDRAILETLYSTGMRRHELVRLGVGDLDRERGTVLIRQGKGKKDRLIPIGERALAWIDKYLADGRPWLPVSLDQGTLFLSGRGEPLCPDRLSALVREYVLQAAVGKVAGCHLFRHTMATLMLEGGADVRFIQEMLGHAKLETTQLYTRVAVRKLKEIHTATHPGARLRRRGEGAAPGQDPDEVEA
jgi:integrase/recombinase XerD